MKLLDKYMLRQYLKTFAFIFVAFICIFVLVDLVEKLPQFLDNKMKFRAILHYYRLTTPWMAHWCLPISALLSTVFFFGQANKFHELTAMKANGLSLYRLAAPFLIFGLALSLFSFFFEDIVVVPSQQQVNEFMANNMKMNSRERNQKIYRQVYFQLPDNQIFTVQRYNIKTKKGRLVGLHTIVDGKITHRYDAQHAHWLDKDKSWRFINVQERSFEPNEVFTKYDTLILKIDVSPRELRAKSVRPENMTFGNLRRFISRSKDLGMNTARWESNLFFRTAMNFSCFLVILLGIPLVTFQTRSGGYGSGVASALLLLFTFYVVLTLGKMLGIAGEMAPFWAVWTPNFIFLGIGILLLLLVKK